MYTAKSIVPAIQDLAGEWVKHAAEGTSSQTDAVVKWALTRINHADVPSVVQGVMLTLTGNPKKARKAQRAASTAVKRATRSLRQSRSKDASRPGARVALIVAAGLCLAAVLIWRMMARPGEPSPVPGGATPPDQAGSPDQSGTNMDKIPFDPVPPVD